MSGDLNRPLKLYYRAGKWETMPDLTTVTLGNGDPVIFYWLDPRPILPLARQGPSVVLGEGLPDIPDEGLVEEVMLFARDGALHAVAWEGGGWRWFEFSEQKQQGWESLSVVKSPPTPVLLRDKGNWPERLHKIEYLYDNRLVAWRLQGWPKAQEPDAAAMEEG